MAHHYLTQTWTGTPAGDLTNAVGNALLARLIPTSAGGIDADAGDAAIDDAEADGDSILGPSFTVPVGTTSTTARIVKRAVADMAIFYLYEHNPEFRASGGDNPEQKRYDRARTQLRDLKSGERDMGDEAKAKSGLTGGVVYASTSQFITDDSESTADGPTGYF